jgi:hypothetical protein
VGKIRLLVEGGGLETERVDNVVDLNGTVLKILLGLLSRGVGTGIWGVLGSCSLDVGARSPHTNLDSAESDHLAVNLVDNAIDLLWVVGVRENLVSGDDVLRTVVSREVQATSCDNFQTTRGTCAAQNSR